MAEQLKDGQGRVIEYLRVSVTDRCDLKCEYCMPPGGMELSPRCEILKYSELLKLIGLFAGLGVRKVRLTGGEPLIRKGILGFIKQVNEISGVERIMLTTNGVRLKRMARRLTEVGVIGVNGSLDSLRRDKYKSITGYDRLGQVMEGINAAREAGLKSVKVNMVVMKGVNDDEIGDFVNLAREREMQVRFLEFMPATPLAWREDRFMGVKEIEDQIRRSGELESLEKGELSGPAQLYRFHEGKGEIGLISAVTNDFCSDCNRLRLTSAGELVSCLFGADRLDLKLMLRSGASQRDLSDAIREAIKQKNAVRALPFDVSEETSKKLKMPAIGG